MQHWRSGRTASWACTGRTMSTACMAESSIMSSSPASPYSMLTAGLNLRTQPRTEGYNAKPYGCKNESYTARSYTVGLRATRQNPRAQDWLLQCNNLKCKVECYKAKSCKAGLTDSLQNPMMRDWCDNPKSEKCRILLETKHYNRGWYAATQIDAEGCRRAVIILNLSQRPHKAIFH